MKRTTSTTLIAAALATPCATMAGAIAPPPSPYESRKLVHINRVDRVSTNADWIWIAWPTGIHPAQLPNLVLGNPGRDVQP